MTQITHDDVLNWGKASGPTLKPRTAPKPVNTEPLTGPPSPPSVKEMPSDVMHALGHLVTDHDWTAQPADPSMVVQAHRYAHGLDGRLDLADSDLDHIHGQTHPVQPMAPYPHPSPYAPVQLRTNGLAIASLVLGITWVWWIGSVLAVIFGVIALKQIEESNGTQAGRGMAIAGTVLGWVGLIPLGFMILFVVIGAVSSSTGY